MRDGYCCLLALLVSVDRQVHLRMGPGVMPRLFMPIHLVAFRGFPKDLSSCSTQHRCSPSQIGMLCRWLGLLVIDRRYARRPKGVHVTQRALVMAFGLGDPLLSQSSNRCGGKQKAASEKSLHRDQKRRPSPPGFSRCLKACLLLSNHSSRQRR